MCRKIPGYHIIGTISLEGGPCPDNAGFTDPSLNKVTGTVEPGSNGIAPNVGISGRIRVPGTLFIGGDGL